MQLSLIELEVPVKSYLHFKISAKQAKPGVDILTGESTWYDFFSPPAVGLGEDLPCRFVMH